MPPKSRGRLSSTSIGTPEKHPAQSPVVLDESESEKDEPVEISSDSTDSPVILVKQKRRGTATARIDSPKRKKLPEMHRTATEKEAADDCDSPEFDFHIDEDGQVEALVKKGLLHLSIFFSIFCFFLVSMLPDALQDLKLTGRRKSKAGHRTVSCYFFLSCTDGTVLALDFI
jgi:hypothetical protein